MDASRDHIPVLLDLTLEVLQPEPGQVFVDCTAGLGGHAAAIAQRLGPEGHVVLVDMDPGNLERAEQAVRAAMNPEDPAAARVTTLHTNFHRIPEELGEIGVRADMVLADLGFASTQVDDPERGMSFRHNGPLDMRLDPSAPITAAELVNTLPERELADLIKRYGEERHARRVAAKVVEARAGSPITTTDQLAELVRSALPGPGGSIHPATRTFQALRIAVNDELGSLETLLKRIGRGAKDARDGGGWLKSGARIGIISFHSLEDRPVKQAFASVVADGFGELITRKPLTAGEREIGENPRSRSAKLRGLRLVG